MATSLVGPLVESAFSAAPVPRPPQPTSARLMVLLSPAYIRGRITLASAVAAATLPVVLIISRRVRLEDCISWLIEKGSQGGGRVIQGGQMRQRVEWIEAAVQIAAVLRFASELFDGFYPTLANPPCLCQA